MLKHHEETIKNVTERFKKREDVIALLVGGSIAHGFASEKSDVDIMIIVSNEDYEKRKKAGDIHYFDQEDCTYDTGYIDGKYISIDFLKMVAERGSDPAGFAFEDSFICFSKQEGLEEILRSITRYPTELKSERIQRFYAQFEAWKWYCYEAIKHNNRYLLNHSISNIVLFGGRMVLAYNERLYPYHKWFLKVLEKVEHKPSDLLERINDLLINHTEKEIEALYKCIMEFTDWGLCDTSWPSKFMIDSELSWLDGNVAVADI
jgi:hypothetical protein